MSSFDRSFARLAQTFLLLPMELLPSQLLLGVLISLYRLISRLIAILLLTEFIGFLPPFIGALCFTDPFVHESTIYFYPS